MSVDPQLTKALAATDLFGSLKKRGLERLASTMSVATHPAGTPITEEGEGAAAFHIILDGTATVSVLGETVNTLGPGGYFGEIALIDGKPRTATVTPDSELKTAGLTAWQFRPLLDEIDGLAVTLLFVVCQRLRNARLA